MPEIRLNISKLVPTAERTQYVIISWYTVLFLRVTMTQEAEHRQKPQKRRQIVKFLFIYIIYKNFYVLRTS